VIVDTSALLAFFNAQEPQHDDVTAALSGNGHGPLVVSPYVLAELDYLVATRVGVEAELAVLRELASSAWELSTFGRNDVDSAVVIIAKHADQAVGLADASLVVLAKRYDTKTIATLDRRHFSTLRPLDGGRFTLVP
jgi:predicted nucleic acid-binding protein